jgi:ABC-type nitrate/sulfonate/bicarbonate transport system substrate-binding protein
MLKANGIERTTLKEITIAPDLKAFISANTHDVQPIYDYDESVTLDKEKVDYTSLRPKDWGVKFKGAAYFTTVATVEKQPDLVQAFVSSIIDGWKAAATNPVSAVQALQSLSPKVDATREAEVLKRGLPYFVNADRQPLTTDPASWAQMTSDLVAFGELSKPADLSKALNLSFVAKAYGK